MTESMTPTPTTPAQPQTHADEGKVAAVIAYILYIVGVFSAHTISPIGVIVAYVSRDGAAPWVRTHFDQQIKMFWTVFWWVGGAVLLTILLVAGLITIPFAFLTGLAAAVLYLIFSIWFAVKSFIGLMQLFNSRPT